MGRRRGGQALAGWPHGDIIENLAQGLGPDPVAPARIVAAQGWRHRQRLARRRGSSEAIAHANQIGVAALRYAAIGAEGAGAVVHPAHERPLGRHQGLDFKAQVVEELAVVLAEGFLVVAGRTQPAHSLHKPQAQPGLHPEAHPQARGEFAEGLGRGIGVFDALVEFAPRLHRGAMAQQVAVPFQGHGAGIDQAFVKAEAQFVFGPQSPLELEGFAEVGIDALAAPEGHGQGVGVPVGDWRQRQRAGHGLGLGRQGHRWHQPVAGRQRPDRGGHAAVALNPRSGVQSIRGQGLPAEGLQHLGPGCRAVIGHGKAGRADQ